MSHIRKIILFLLSFLPIQAIAYAVEYNNTVSSEKINEFDIESEFLERLENGTLTEKYYNFLKKYGIYSVEDLYGNENRRVRARILDAFGKELRDTILMNGSPLSIDDS